jgi:DNA-binding MarR family transcriptional regulator
MWAGASHSRSRLLHVQYLDVTTETSARTTWLAIPEADREAWGGFRRAAVEVIARLDADLQDHLGLGYTDFDALVQLSIAESGRMRMADLARAVSRSPSALTRVVGRLEDRGLVTRTRLHRTEVIATITVQGHELLAEASPRHLALVDELFWSPLTPTQRGQMGRLSQRLLEASASPRC